MVDTDDVPCTDIQKKPDVEKWALTGSLTKFNKEKCKVLLLGRNNLWPQRRLGSDQLGISLVEKDLVVLGNTLDMNQHCAPEVIKVKSTLEFIRPSVASRTREVLFPC